jgi:hypothetical protein
MHVCGNARIFNLDATEFTSMRRELPHESVVAYGAISQALHQTLYDCELPQG